MKHCLSNIIYISLQCYKFVGKDSSEQKTWHDARQYCISQGGNLVSILNQVEQGNSLKKNANYFMNVLPLHMSFITLLTVM